MPHLIRHEYWVFVSLIACIAGLLLLFNTKRTNAKQQVNEVEETERSLLTMSFSYWMVYCIAFGIQKLNLPDWETLLLSLKLTTAFSYCLTFSCILSLPLHRFAVWQGTKIRSSG